MANASIHAAFERMWEHVKSGLAKKAEKGHTHPEYANASHRHYAADINGGMFSGTVQAYSSGQAPATSCLRNSKLVSTDTTPTVNGEINWTYK